MKNVKSTIPPKYIKLLNDSINESYDNFYNTWKFMISGGKRLYNAAELNQFELDFNKKNKTSLFHVMKKSIRNEFEQKILSYTNQQKAESYIIKLVNKSFFFYSKILLTGTQIIFHEIMTIHNTNIKYQNALKKLIPYKIPPKVYCRANQLFEKHKKENEKFDKDKVRITLKYCLLESVKYWRPFYPMELEKYDIPFYKLKYKWSGKEHFEKIFANYKKWRKRINKHPKA